MGGNRAAHLGTRGDTKMDTKQSRALDKRERQQAVAQARKNKRIGQTYATQSFADFSVAYKVKKGQ